MVPETCLERLLATGLQSPEELARRLRIVHHMFAKFPSTHRLHSSSFLGLPYRILYT